MENTLYFGDNLKIIREYIKDESIDLIYLDPPFNSKRDYNVIFKSPEKEDSTSQIQAFEDTWHWQTGETEFEFNQIVKGGGAIAEVMKGLELIVGKNDLLAYLTMMAIRIKELNRVLKDTGSLYLHCDSTASHYLKLILDAIFEAKNFRNEIIWKRSNSHPLSVKKFEAITDTILVYGKSENAYFSSVTQPLDNETIERDYKSKDEHGHFQNILLTGGKAGGKEAYLPFKGALPSEGRAWAPPRRETLPDFMIKDLSPDYEKMNQLEKCHELDRIGLIYWSKTNTPRFKRYLPKNPTQLATNLWDDFTALSSQAKERMGYPTQKPLALLRRIIKASSKEGDVVLDPFCGCGTAIVAAQKLKRKWIGIDITHLAIGLMEQRMEEQFGIRPKVVGNPASFTGAENLFKRNPFDFEKWAVTRLDGIHPTVATGDKGIDGKGYVGPDLQYRVLVSVKGGKNLNPGMVRDLVGTVEREKADFGILLTIHNPTDGMKKEAVIAGIVETPLGHHFPKIQIYTVSDYFNGNKPKLP